MIQRLSPEEHEQHQEEIIRGLIKMRRGQFLVFTVNAIPVLTAISLLTSIIAVPIGGVLYLNSVKESIISSIDIKLERINERFEKIEPKITAIERHLDKIEFRLDAVEKRLDAVEKRLDAVEKRLDSMDKKLDQAIADSVARDASLQQQIVAITKRTKGN